MAPDRLCLDLADEKRREGKGREDRRDVCVCVCVCDVVVAAAAEIGNGKGKGRDVTWRHRSWPIFLIH